MCITSKIFCSYFPLLLFVWKKAKKLLSFHYFLFPVISILFKKYVSFLKQNFLWARKMSRTFIFNTISLSLDIFTVLHLGVSVQTNHLSIGIFCCVGVYFFFFFAKGERLKQCWTCAFYYLRCFFRLYVRTVCLSSLVQCFTFKDIHNTSCLYLLPYSIITLFAAQKLFYSILNYLLSTLYLSHCIFIYLLGLLIHTWVSLL